MNKLFSLLLLALPALLLAPAAPAQTLSYDRATVCGSGDGNYDWGPRQLTTDAQGNTYVTGTFNGTIVLGSSVLSATQTAPNRRFPSDVFVAKLDPAGNYVWAVQLGDNQEAVVNGLAVDAQGEVYITGSFSSYSLRVGAGGPQLFNSSARSEGFVAKLNGQTGQCRWARRAGGTGDDWLSKPVLNAAGDVYLLGGSASAVADYGAITLTNTVSVLAKLSGTGTWLWARAAGTGTARVNNLLLDAQGELYLTGTFSPPSATFGTTILTTQVVANTSPLWQDVFVAKVTDAGVWRWAVQGDGVGQQNMVSTLQSALDSTGHIYVAGSYVGTALQLGTTHLPNQSVLLPPPIGPAPPTPNTGNYGDDAFVARLNAGTGAWEWAVRNGGAYGDGAYALVVDAGQQITVLGVFDNNVLTNAQIKLARLDASTGAWQGFYPLNSGQVTLMTSDQQYRIWLGGHFFQPTLTLGPLRLAQAGPNQATGFVARIGALGLATRSSQRTGEELQVWPNPTAGRTVQVQGPAPKQPVEVLDVLGRQITSGRMPGTGPLQLVLPASLPGGVYVVRGGGQARRLLVE